MRLINFLMLLNDVSIYITIRNSIKSHEISRALNRKLQLHNIKQDIWKSQKIKQIFWTTDTTDPKVQIPNFLTLHTLSKEVLLTFFCPQTARY